MKPRLAISLALVATMVVAIGAVYRCLQIADSPSGGGRSHESPDKQLTATALDMTERYYFGGSRSFYDFVVETRTRTQVRHVVIEQPPEGMINWRSDGSITWANDSSSVTYSFKGTQLTLDIRGSEN